MLHSALARRTVLLAGAALALPSLRVSAQTAQAAQAPILRSFSGRASDLQTGRWLYTEQHRHEMRGARWWAGSVKYVSPEGAVLGEKTLDFSQDRFIPLVRTVFMPGGDEEIISRIEAASVTMETLSAGKRTVRQVERAPVMAADSGFHAYIQANLEELLNGKTLQLAFGVVNQHSSFRFRIRRTDLRTVGSRTHLSLLAEPDSLLRLVADPLTLVYDAQSRDLLEYQGLSNLSDPRSGKTPKVKIVYSYGDFADSG